MSQNLKLANVFTDNMVLQRNMRIPIWGTAKEETKIKVEFCGQVCESEVVNGDWRVYISPLEAGGPHKMRIIGSVSEVVLENILIGEVYVAGGQSNMQFILQDSLNGKEAAYEANFNEIRYYDVPRIAFEVCNNQENTENVGWQICNPVNAGEFSAVAFYFARKLFSELKVPIGIIGCNWGGTSASCWMSREYLSGDNEIKVYLEEYNEQIKNIDEETYDIQLDEYNKRVEAYTKKVSDFKLSNPDADQNMINAIAGDYPWPPPIGEKSFLRPAGLYYTMLKKIVTYGIRGVIFYQGESDTPKPSLYKKLFGKMIQNWRGGWNNQELPFLFVQLPFYGDKATQDSWAILREAQVFTMQEDKNTAMAIIIDCGEENDIHPINKRPVGERLALLALARIYNFNITYSGPIYRDYKTDGDKIILYFENADKGLIAKGDRIKGFMICGKDKNFVNAKAEIKGNTIELCAKNILHPIEVKYGWVNYTELNLFNTEGLPMSPFRLLIS